MSQPAKTNEQLTIVRVHSVSSVRKQYDRSRTVSRSVFVLFVVLIEKYECLRFIVQTVRSYCLHISRTVCYFYNEIPRFFENSWEIVVKIANSTTNVQTVRAYCLHCEFQTLVLFNQYDKQYENRVLFIYLQNAKCKTQNAKCKMHKNNKKKHFKTILHFALCVLHFAFCTFFLRQKCICSRLDAKISAKCKIWSNFVGSKIPKKWFFRIAYIVNSIFYQNRVCFFSIYVFIFDEQKSAK